MAQSTPRRFEIIRCYAASAGSFYVGLLTLGAMLVDSATAQAGLVFDRFVNAIARLASLLPGVSHWPSLVPAYDAEGHFQISALIPAAALILVAAVFLGRARVLTRERAEDLKEERKELVRIRTREGGRIVSNQSRHLDLKDSASAQRPLPGALLALEARTL
jgi:hypothetical protein